MIMWNVKYDDREYDLDVGDCTILVGQSTVWYELIRMIDDYFNNRSSTVQIVEDASVIQKKDWNCYFIPFDAQLQLDKITAKSPLHPVIGDCIEQISMSPAFHELKEMWEELQEEAFFINESLKKYELKATINDLDEADLKNFISLSSTKPLLSPLEYKLLLLRLIEERSVDKKTLIIIELPELFADVEGLSELEGMIQKMRTQGFRFFLITSRPEFFGRRNYSLYNQIINEASVELVKRKVMADAPFGVEDAQFELAKLEAFKTVDNLVKKGISEDLSSGKENAIQMLTFTILRSLNIPQHVDTKGFSPNIIDFIKQY